MQSVSKQRIGKHASTFSIRSVKIGYKEDIWGNQVKSGKSGCEEKS
jgi:hypothetical protein